MTFESRADFSDKSKVIRTAEFAGEVIELKKLSIGWRPWQYQVNVKQGTLYHTMANFRTLGDAKRLWESWTGKDIK